MTSSIADLAEITLGVCDGCNNYVPFIRLADRKDARVFKCNFTVDVLGVPCFARQTLIHPVIFTCHQPYERHIIIA